MSTEPAAKPENVRQKTALNHTHKGLNTTQKEATRVTDGPISSTPEPVRLPLDEPAVTRAPEPAAVVCKTCGTVERVVPVEQQGSTSGLGAIAGGVLGAVVGNQVGGGDGRKLATVLGAVGGGLAGNSVEKNMNKSTHYRVVVRMDDGSTRTFQQADPAMVGARVMVEGNTLRAANR